MYYLAKIISIISRLHLAQDIYHMSYFNKISFNSNADRYTDIRK